MTSEVAAWVGGFVAAEGSFTVHRFGRVKKFVFKVELGGRDPEPVALIQRFMKVGRIEKFARRRAHYDDVIRYVLPSLGDQVRVVIPFMDEHLPPSYKRQQYLAWREELVEYWEHQAKRVRPCTVEACETPRRAHGMCRKHLHEAGLG